MTPKEAAAVKGLIEVLPNHWSNDYDTVIRVISNEQFKVFCETIDKMAEEPVDETS